MKIEDALASGAQVRIVPGFGSRAAERYIKRREQRLKEHDITPTIDACLAYDLGRADVLSAEAIESQTNDSKEQE